MKTKLYFLFASTLVAICAFADSTSELISLNEFLEARSTENVLDYERAANVVKREAENGSEQHQFLIAAVCKEPDFPASAAISDVLRDRYLNANRSGLKKIADKSNNSLLYYILSLEGTKDAASYLQKAMQGGNVYALNDHGVKVLTKLQTSKKTLQSVQNNLKVCFDCFKRAADKDDSTGLYNLGVCYLNGYGCRANESEAFECFNRAADRGHPKAINEVGVFYRDGKCVDKNEAEALLRFERAMQLGCIDARYNYAIIMLSKANDIASKQKALSILEVAARCRHLEAMNEYANCLYDCVGIDFSLLKRLRGPELDAAKEKIEAEQKSNYHQAVSWWYYCATKHNHFPAMLSLAKCFVEGKGVEKNDVAAVELYQQAADAGYVPAMLKLAECYDKGIGGLKKSRYNANWWRTRVNAIRGDRNARVWLSKHRLQ